MKKTSLILFALAVGLSSCGDQANEKRTSENMNEEFSDNPLVMVSELPYLAPDFTQIKNEHFEPAIMEGIRVKRAHIEKIIDQEEEPTFENTLVALEKSGEQLSRAANVFYALTGAHTNDTLQALNQKLAPLFSELNDEIYLNSALFERIKKLHDQKATLSLDAESEKLLEEYYKDFVVAGANLSTEEKEKLKEINSNLASLTAEFGKTLLAATNEGALIITDKKELEGLSESTLASLKTEDGAYRIPILNTTQQPLLSSLSNRATRQKVFENAWNRTSGEKNNTEDLVMKLATLRLEKAQLLGFETYADWSLQKTMIKNKDNVRNFFDGLIPAAIEKAQEESKMIEEMMHADGIKGDLEPWDWNYYAEKVRKAKYDLDENEIKPYFEMMSVLENGVFYAAEKLYGITFKKRDDIPVYHEDVLVYEVFEEDGSELGLFYADFYSRESKRGGAWMSNFVDQSHLFGTKPVIYNVCNYPKPADGEPTLLSFDNAITMFHEFGHALHGFFANQKYPSLSGTSVARDFVEFPSQLNESWATEPEVLNNYALHYQTRKVIPTELLNKIQAAGTFNQGYGLTENLASSNIDFAWHTISSQGEITDVKTFEKTMLNKYGLDKVHAVKPRYSSSYFAHVFSGGYAAGYYSYLWTEMLHHDAYQWFKENGGMTRENGQRYRDMVLSVGNTLDYDAMYKDWSGRAPEIAPMIKARGLN
ncbi:M3 family metallopeptidase [Brumimicrobium sp.]|uniref:M3 family metallopeptidase n=1 Tax=Brumimicrobium sp. TaxID=2029867 RepID=UPI003A923568